MTQVFISASFDNLGSQHMRFLHEASRLGELNVQLWTDEAVEKLAGNAPKFPAAERLYFLDSIRYVKQVTLTDVDSKDRLEEAPSGSVWVVSESEANAAKEAFCQEHGLEYHVITDSELAGYPEPIEGEVTATGKPQVVVTGCYDWFHTGHVRFFEEVSEHGDLHVVVGHDANIKLLKGEGHPMYNEDERRYMAGSIKFVKQAYVSSGNGWLDAEPEIDRIKPDIYAVNEDGDVPEKSNFCQEKGIEYRVLKRTPKAGLPKRQSTDLRGF